MPSEVVTYEFAAKVDDALGGIKKLYSALNDLDKASKTMNSFNQISKSFKNASIATSNLANKLNNLSNQFKRTASSSNLFSQALSALAGIQLGKWLADGTKSMIDYTETVNLFNVAMKDSRDEAVAWVDSISSMYGLDPKWLMQATGIFYEMAYAVGMPDEAARTLSTSLTSLSVDLASLINVDVETAADNLTSGIRGMSKAVVKYGMDVRATTVEQYALSMGITENYETMNEASREILRYLVMVEQATDATGDFAKTLESPANQLRIMKEQFIQLGRAVGSILLNALAPILPVINGIIMALRVMIEVFSALLGISYEMPDFSASFGSDSDSALGGIASGVEEVGDAADETQKKLQRMVAPFDELNILQESQESETAGVGVGGVGTGGISWGEVDPRLLEALEASEYKLQEVQLAAEKTKLAILEFFGITPDGDSWVYAPDVFEEKLKGLLPGWEQSITELFDLDYSSVLSGFGAIWDTLKEIAGLVGEQLVADFTALFGVTPDEALANFIRELPGNLEKINEWLQTNKETIALVVTRVLELWAAWQLITAASSLISSALGIAGTAATIASGFFSALSVVTSPLGKLFSTLATSIFNFGIAITAPPVAAFSGQVALASTNSGGLLTQVGLLATHFSGPLAAALTGVIAIGAALFVGGFVDWAANSDKFREQLSGIFDKIGDIFTHFGELFSAVVGAFKAGCNFMSENFGGVYEAIVGIVDSILDALDGIIVFLTGVFEGDWEKAWLGLSNIFVAAANALGYVGAGVINAIIGILNLAIDNIINGIIGAINDVLSALSDVLDFVGIDLSLSLPDVPSIPSVSYTPIPDIKLATGGVTTGPTRALIGEGVYDEAVIPLGDSPQLADMLDKFAGVVQAQNGNGETIVKVYIGGKEWDAFTYKSSKRGEKIVGKQPVKESAYA